MSKVGYQVQGMDYDLAGKVEDKLGTFDFHWLDGRRNPTNQLFDLLAKEKNQYEKYLSDPKKYVKPPQFLELRRGTIMKSTPIKRVQVY